MTTANEAYIGIDVGKTWLDVALWGKETVWRVTNDGTGIREILEWVMELDPQAIGKLAKTDVIDARLIAEYAIKIQPVTIPPKEESEIRLKALITRREQLVEMRIAEKNRLGTALASMKDAIREHIDWMGTQLKELEVEIHELISGLPEWKAKAECLDSIPGVGLITVVTLLADLPELGQLDRQKVAALAGLAPFNRDSGQKRGHRRIFGGRKGIRRVLYMACLSAIKCNPVIRTLYSRLMENGKLFKVAITACMRKMLTIMNAMVRDHVNWREPVTI